MNWLILPAQPYRGRNCFCIDPITKPRGWPLRTLFIACLPGAFSAVAAPAAGRR